MVEGRRRRRGERNDDDGTARKEKENVAFMKKKGKSIVKNVNNFFLSDSFLQFLHSLSDLFDRSRHGEDF